MAKSKNQSAKSTTAKSINPFNEEIVWTHPLIDSDEVDEKIELAAEVQKLWFELPLTDRLECLKKLSEVFERRKEELAKVIVAEMGKTMKAAIAEVEKCSFTVKYLSENFAAWSEPVGIDMPKGKHRVSFQPLGVTLGIMPWNFPIWQAVRFLAPSLAVGNAVLLKPASNVFQSSKLLEECCLEAGFPEGLYQHLSLSGGDVAQVIEHELVAGVSLTGSAPAGKSVGEIAGKHMKKMVFELGGSDPYIVLEDADLELAASKCAESRLLNSGQSCICAKRFIVQDTVYEKFLTLFNKEMSSKNYGDPMSEETDFGPLARKDLRDDLHKQVLKAVKAGGQILTGGEVPREKGCFYPATVIADVDVYSDIYQEEFFGPVALVNSFSTIEEAFEIANNTPFGLGSGIFSRDGERAAALAEKYMQAGMVVVNDYIRSDVRLPFGGVKDSGFGRELSPFGVHEFANVKSISIF